MCARSRAREASPRLPEMGYRDIPVKTHLPRAYLSARQQRASRPAPQEQSISRTFSIMSSARFASPPAQSSGTEYAARRAHLTYSFASRVRGPVDAWALCDWRVLLRRRVVFGSWFVNRGECFYSFARGQASWQRAGFPEMKQ